MEEEDWMLYDEITKKKYKFDSGKSDSGESSRGISEE